MTRQTAFWRNAAIVAVIHGIVLVGLVRWSSSAKTPPMASVVWMDSATAAVQEAPDSSPPADPEPTPTPWEDPLTMRTPPPEQTEEPTATPAPTSTPRPKPTPKPTSTPSAKKLTAKNSAKPTAAPKKSLAKAKTTPTKSPASSSTATATGQSSEGASASQANWYGNMLHSRFFSAWDQPTSVVASGAKMSGLVRVRIEKDGRVSDFSLVRPSGNVIVDESISAVAKRVTQVDPLPAGLGSGGHYDVNINFELNAQ